MGWDDVGLDDILHSFTQTQYTMQAASASAPGLKAPSSLAVGAAIPTTKQGVFSQTDAPQPGLEETGRDKPSSAAATAPAGKAAGQSAAAAAAVAKPEKPAVERLSLEGLDEAVANGLRALCQVSVQPCINLLMLWLDMRACKLNSVTKARVILDSPNCTVLAAVMELLLMACGYHGTLVTDTPQVIRKNFTKAARTSHSELSSLTLAVVTGFSFASPHDSLMLLLMAQHTEGTFHRDLDCYACLHNIQCMHLIFYNSPQPSAIAKFKE